MKLCIQKWCVSVGAVWLLLLLLLSGPYRLLWSFRFSLTLMWWCFVYIFSLFVFLCLRSLASSREPINERRGTCQRMKLLTLNQNDGFLPFAIDMMTIQCVFQFSLQNGFLLLFDCLSLNRWNTLPSVTILRLQQSPSIESIEFIEDQIFFSYFNFPTPIKSFSTHPTCTSDISVAVVAVYFHHRAFNSTSPHHYCHNFSVCLQIFLRFFSYVICVEDWHICLSMSVSVGVCVCARFPSDSIRSISMDMRQKVATNPKKKWIEGMEGMR